MKSFRVIDSLGWDLFKTFLNLITALINVKQGCAYVRLKFQGFHAFHACALHILT